MGKIEAVIFDWAGTTVDFGCFAPVQAFVEVFKHFGIEPTMEEVRKPMGMLKRDHIKTMLYMDRIHKLWLEKYGHEVTEEDIDSLYNLFEDKLLGILDQFAEPKPYVLEAVQKLRGMGVKIGSTTGYTDKMMEIVTREAKEAGLVQPGFRRKCRTSLPIYGVQKHGGIKMQLCSFCGKGRRYSFRY